MQIINYSFRDFHTLPILFLKWKLSPFHPTYFSIGANPLSQQNAPRGANQVQQQQQFSAPPGYRPQQRWGGAQQQRPSYLPQKKSVTSTQSSALVAQLTQPPSTTTPHSLSQLRQSKLAFFYTNHCFFNCLFCVGNVSLVDPYKQQQPMNLPTGQQQNVQAPTQGVSNPPQTTSQTAAQPAQVNKKKRARFCAYKISRGFAWSSASKVRCSVRRGRRFGRAYWNGWKNRKIRRHPIRKSPNTCRAECLRMSEMESLKCKHSWCF